MENRHLVKYLLICFFFVQVFINTCHGAACRGLSADVTCQCDDFGRCMKGTIEIDPWLQFALKTQREIQIDINLDQVQMFDSHNAFNARGYGIGYGANDSCLWPPPYEDRCMGLANHEFTLTDQLNMGVRALEIDNWWCADAMRTAHMGSPAAVICRENNELFADIIAEIGAWMDTEGNENEIIRIYLNEKYDQGHDDEVNGPFERYIGDDRLHSPADFKNMYGEVWPPMRQFLEDGKRMHIVASSDRQHQGKYLHPIRCDGSGYNSFTNYPMCGGKTDTNCRRFRGDATHYVSSIIYDGPTSSGAILDMSEMVKCRINLPATDMVTPQLMETAVYTWAKGEPSLQLNANTCVMLNHEDFRWYTSSACDQSLSYACQSLSYAEDWTISETTGPYDVTQDLCPSGYKFSLPHNGYRQQKLREAMQGKSVWLNYTPWLTGTFPTVGQETPEPTPTSGSTTHYNVGIARYLPWILSSLILALRVIRANV